MVGTITLDIHTLMYASVAITVGFQSMLFWTFAKIYGMRVGIVPWDPWFRRIIGAFTLETGLVVGAALLIVGLSLAVYALSAWNLAGFGPLRPSDTMRLVIPSATAILLGFQTAYGAFFVSVLEIRGSGDETPAREIVPQRESAIGVRAEAG
jgi:hypothetical protein